MSESIVEAVRTMTNKEIVSTIVDLVARVTALEAQIQAQSSKPTVTEMTDDHARRVLNGNLSDKKHKEAAELLGLTYGQIYSCRLGFTFKAIHKELASNGFKNPWVK